MTKRQQTIKRWSTCMAQSHRVALLPVTTTAPAQNLPTE